MTEKSGFLVTDGVCEKKLKILRADLKAIGITSKKTKHRGYSVLEVSDIDRAIIFLSEYSRAIDTAYEKHVGNASEAS